MTDKKQEFVGTLSMITNDYEVKNSLETNPHYMADNPVDNKKWEAAEDNIQ